MFWCKWQSRCFLVSDDRHDTILFSWVKPSCIAQTCGVKRLSWDHSVRPHEPFIKQFGLAKTDMRSLQMEDPGCTYCTELGVMDRHRVSVRPHVPLMKCCLDCRRSDVRSLCLWEPSCIALVWCKGQIGLLCLAVGTKLYCTGMV